MAYIKIKKNRLFFIISSITAFLGIETIARIYNWYELYPMYDNLSHFLFGVSWLGLYWLSVLYRNYKLPKTFYKNATISYIIVALFWEFLEKIGDSVLFTTDYLQDLFFWDGVTDVIVGYVGLWISYKILKERLK